jgi:hypothetical protein
LGSLRQDRSYDRELSDPGICAVRRGVGSVRRGVGDRLANHVGNPDELG